MAFEQRRTIADIMLANTGAFPTAVGGLAQGYQRGLENRDRRTTLDQNQQTIDAAKTAAEQKAIVTEAAGLANVLSQLDPEQKPAYWNEVRTFTQRTGGVDPGEYSPDLEKIFIAKAGVQPQERRVIKDASGRQRYADDQSFVFDKVDTSVTSDRKTAKDRNGVLRFTDDGERVFPNVEKVDTAEDKLKRAAENIKTEEGLRKEFNTLLKDFNLVSGAYARVKAAADEPSAAGDLALIFNYMKMLDPGSTVREGEFATAQNAAGVGGRIVALYNNVLEGQRMNTTQRADFVGRSNKLFQAATTEAQKTADAYKGIATRNGVNVDNVLANFIEKKSGSSVNDDQGDLSDKEYSELLRLRAAKKNANR